MHQRIQGKAPSAQELVEASHCVSAGRSSHLAPAIGEEAQRPLGGDGGIELAERARGGIAWIGEQPLAGLRLRIVQALEVGAAHIDLASDLERVGEVRAI